MPQTRITSLTRQRARKLRANMTDAEKRLWRELRAWNKAGLCKFRRQASIGPYIADFADYGRSMVIEVDGGQRGEPGADLARDAWLRAQGFQVIRVWNNDVLGGLPGVLETIHAALAATTPPPTPPHKGEGGAHRARGARIGDER